MCETKEKRVDNIDYLRGYNVNVSMGWLTQCCLVSECWEIRQAGVEVEGGGGA